MIIDIPDVWATAAQAHRRFVNQVFFSAINRLDEVQGPCTIHQRASVFLIDNLHALISSTARGLPSVVANFDAAFPIERDREVAHQLFSQLIDYDEFSKKDGWETRAWSAYKLCASTRYVICPYCHMAPIDTKLPTDESPDSYRPNLDHFYAKGRYPYLALTLGNLIPSCERCNGPALKHNADFITLPHLHPQSDPESVVFELSLRFPLAAGSQDTLSLYDSPNNYEINLMPNGKESAKADASIRTFQLRARYQIFVEEAFRLRRQLRTSRSRSRMAESDLPALGVEISDVLGFEVKGDAYKNTIAGRLWLDLYKALAEGA